MYCSFSFPLCSTMFSFVSCKLIRFFLYVSIMSSIGREWSSGSQLQFKHCFLWSGENNLETKWYDDDWTDRLKTSSGFEKVWYISDIIQPSCKINVNNELHYMNTIYSTWIATFQKYSLLPNAYSKRKSVICQSIHGGIAYVTSKMKTSRTWR